MVYNGIKISQVASFAIIASKFLSIIPIALLLTSYTFLLLISLLVRGDPDSSFFKMTSKFFANLIASNSIDITDIINKQLENINI